MQTAPVRPSSAARLGRLIDLASDRGGWPYYAGQPPRIEPTCWALLAIGAAARAPRETAAVRAGRAFLRSLRAPSGLLVEPSTPGPNYAWNALALLALAGREDADLVNQVATGLAGVRGIQLEASDAIRLNSRLQAWSWVEGTFSWIEPTALAVWALKVRRLSSPELAVRLADGEAMLLDRVCQGGGWNYGNSTVLDQDLRPYMPTTALALLALQDRRDHPAVKTSVEWLVAHAVSERSAMALGLAAIALEVYGRPVEAVLGALGAQEARTNWLGNAHLMALAHYALTLPAHRAAAVRIQ